MKFWKKPTDDLVQKTLESVKTETDRQYFFSRLKNPHWIEPLKARGFFRHPPEVKLLPDGYVQYPFWPEIQFLKNVANEASERVIEVILEIPKTDNPRFYNNVIDIALKIEASLSIKLKARILEYVNGKYLFLNPRFDEVLRYWVTNGQTESALELAGALITFQSDSQARAKEERRRANPDDLTTLLEPRPRFDEWEYQEILAKGVRPLSEKTPYQTAQILIDATATMICLQFHQDDLEKSSGNDGSMIWCLRVNESGEDYQDSKATLVHALTFACKKVYENAPESVSALDQEALGNQRWDIFTRIRQHLYALHPNEHTKPWIREMILAHEDYDKREHHFEFQRMIRIACENLGADLLTKAERKRLFEAILSGPSEQDFRDRLGDDFTEEAFEGRKRYFHRMQLSPFASVLFGKYANYFQELKAKEEKPVTDNDYAPWRSEGGIREERSPKPVEELANMSDEKLLSFLNEWENVHRDPDKWLVDINFEGLARTFQSIFKEIILPDESRFNFWIENRERIKRPIYVRSMVSAIHEQVKLRQFDKLNLWFDLCEWVLSHLDQSKEEGVNRSDESGEHPDWQSSRRVVGDFVGTCLEKDVNVPVSVRDRLASLLDKLCTQYDRRLDDDEPTLLNPGDPLTEAISKTRSRALEDLVYFGYWVRRQLKDDQADAPEVFEILEKRLGSECEHPLKLPEYAILGRHYSLIFGLKQEWATQHKSNFFPQANLLAWTEAFGNFLKYNRPYRPTFDIVRGDIEFALEHIDEFEVDNRGTRNLADSLGEHLFTYYLWEVYPLTGDGSLLERFYEKTKEDRDHWSRLFDYVGRSLRNSGKQLEENLKQRIIEFFDWRFEKKDPTELRKFTFWLEAECLDAEWRLISCSEILNVLESGELTGFSIGCQVAVLRGMLEDHAALVVKCFAKLTELAVKNDAAIYIQTDKAMPILRAGLDSDDATVRENAKRAYDNLLRSRRFEFLDVEN